MPGNRRTAVSPEDTIKKAALGYFKHIRTGSFFNVKNEAKSVFCTLNE